MKEIIIYTDGACSGNPGPGGWGALFIHNGNRKTISGSEEHTTNNRMEMMAALEALKQLKTICKGKLYTDSTYLKQGINSWMPKWKKNNWRGSDKKPVKNVDLWQALDEEIAKHQIEFHWVKAHNGHPENELADELARAACQKYMK